MTDYNGCSLTNENWNDVSKKLKAPFPESEINVRVGQLFKNNTLTIVLPYIDARQVMERLDRVVGPENWSDNYKVVDSQSVICDLTIHGVTKSDAGQSKKDGDRGEAKALKAAVSDAFKRAAVKWGIGQFLYSLPKQFENLDANKRLKRDSASIVRDILRKAGLSGPQPKPKPSPRITPKADTTPVVDSTGLTSDQKTEIQELKNKLNIRVNPMLDPFVVDWSQKKLSSYRDLDKNNVDSFMKFLRDKYVRQPVESGT